MKKIIFFSLLLVSVFCLFLVVSCGSKTKTTVIETNMGTMEIELFTEKAPITTKNFITLAGS